MLRGIIFDFDGVIVESVHIKSDAFAELYASHGTDIVKKVVEHHEANGGMSRSEKIKFYHKSILNIKIAKKELKDLANQFSHLVVEKVIAASYVPGALEYIQQCYKKYQLFISTGTPIQEIKQILSNRGIIHYFTDVFGSPFKKDRHIKNIISKYNISSDELLFYGDSNTDLDAAKRADIEFVLIRNQYNKMLAHKYNGYIIDDFTMLL